MIVTVDDRCSGCGSCLTTCPAGALRPARRHPALDPLRCTGCLACIEVCPVDAITEWRTG
jgi:NAD-dependent dihydropyrimidine dehydrogenase PreA subunit